MPSLVSTTNLGKEVRGMLKQTPRIAKWKVEVRNKIKMLVCECGYTHPYPKVGCYGKSSGKAILGQVNNIRTHHEKHSPNHLAIPLPWKEERR